MAKKYKTTTKRTPLRRKKLEKQRIHKSSDVGVKEKTRRQIGKKMREAGTLMNKLGIESKSIVNGSRYITISVKKLKTSEMDLE